MFLQPIYWLNLLLSLFQFESVEQILEEMSITPSQRNRFFCQNTQRTRSDVMMWNKSQNRKYTQRSRYPLARPDSGQFENACSAKSQLLYAGTQLSPRIIVMQLACEHFSDRARKCTCDALACANRCWAAASLSRPTPAALLNYNRLVSQCFGRAHTPYRLIQRRSRASNASTIQPANQEKPAGRPSAAGATQ